jgi:hypothetical protein
MLKLHNLTPQPDIDSHDNLLDRAEAICLVRTGIPRQVHKLVSGQEAPRSSVDDLFVCWCWRLRPTSGIIQQHLDGRAVDNIEPDDIATTVAAYLEGSIEHEDILQCLPKPGREGLLAIRPAPKLGQPVDPRCGIGGRAFFIA